MERNMFEAFKGNEKTNRPITPTNVTVDVQKENIKCGYYLGYRIDHNGDFKLIGLCNDKTISDMMDDSYKQIIIDKYKTEDLGLSRLGASFANKPLDEVMSHKVIFIPVENSTIINFDIKEIKEEPTEETK